MTETKKEESVFEELSKINVKSKTEVKAGMTYLSWAWAWIELKKRYPNATYKVYERETEFGPVPYFTDGKTCWVKVSVTVENMECLEMLPIMDYKNKPIAYDKVTSFDANKAIKRCLAKAIALHGLGINLYAGEDLPEAEQERINAEAKAKQEEARKQKIEHIKSMTENQVLTYAKGLAEKREKHFMTEVSKAFNKKKEEGAQIQKISDLGAEAIREILYTLV